MVYTLSQAMIPSILQLPIVLLIMIVATVVAVYYTANSKGMRNFWVGNRGQTTLLFLVAFLFIGQGVEIPYLVFAGINLLVALILFPLLLAGFVVITALGPGSKGKICS